MTSKQIGSSMKSVGEVKSNFFTTVSHICPLNSISIPFTFKSSDEFFSLSSLGDGYWQNI